MYTFLLDRGRGRFLLSLALFISAVEMINIIVSVTIGLSVQQAPSAFLPTALNNRFALSDDLMSASKTNLHRNEHISSNEHWSSSEEMTQWPVTAELTNPETMTNISTTTLYYEEIDPNRNGRLKEIGSINVGFGVGVGVAGNDPVSVGTRVGVGFGESGIAGKLPIGQDIFPMQGQSQSLNDYDGDKSNIVADRAQKYWLAAREGRIRIPHYRPPPSLVDVRSHIDISTVG